VDSKSDDTNEYSLVEQAAVIDIHWHSC